MASVPDVILGLSKEDMGGIDVSLLQMQSALGSCAVPSLGTTLLLQRYLAALKAGMSQQAMKSSVDLGGMKPKKIRQFIRDEATSMGLGLLVERKGDIECVPVSVDGQRMGTMYLRDIKRVLFYVLLQSTGANCLTEPAVLKAPDGSRLFADKLSLDSGKSIFDEVTDAARKGISERLLGLLDAELFRTSPLLLGLANDATARETTTEGVWDPLTVQMGNLDSTAIHRHPATGLLAFMPVFSSPFAPKTKEHRLFTARARIALHAALDVIYDRIRAACKGLMWELFPGLVIHWLPRVYARSGDHPKQQAEVGQMGSASSRSPCRLCQLPARHKCLARLFEPKRVFSAVVGESPLRCLSAAAAVAPKGPIADRRVAQGFGAQLLGRTPAPFTPAAVSISSRVPTDAAGALGILHNVKGLGKHLVQMLTSEKAGHGPLLLGEAVGVLQARIAQLRPYSGPASRVLPVKSAAAGKRVPTNKYASLMLLLPGAAEGLLDTSVWLRYTNACMAVHRLLLSLQQDTISQLDSGRITLEARVMVKTLMVFPHFRKRIKPHLTLHMGALVPLSGPPSSLCEARTEGFHVVVKLTARLTKAGEGQEANMLLMRGHMELTALLASLRELRRGAAEKDAQAAGSGSSASASAAAGGGGGAGSAAHDSPPPISFPPVNMAGRLSSLSSPPELSVLACRNIRDITALPGFAPAARLDPTTPMYFAGGRAGTGGARVRGGRGAALTSTSLPICISPLVSHVVAGELCFRYIGAELPPAAGGNAAQASARLAWRNALIAITQTCTWRGEASLTAAHFNAPTMRLTAAGRALLIGGSGVTVHDTLRYGAGKGMVPPHVIFSRKRPAVSFVVKPGHMYLAGKGMGVAIGDVLGYLTFPAVPLRAHGQASFALLHSLTGDAGAAGDMEPLMDGLMVPMRLMPPDRWDSYMLVGVGLILRKEHVQPRHGVSEEEPLDNCVWWYPQGGTDGRLQPQPMPALVDCSESPLPVVEVEEEEEEEEEGEGEEGEEEEEEEEEGEEEEDEEEEEEEDEEEGGEEELTGCYCGEEATSDMLECANLLCKYVTIHRACSASMAGTRTKPRDGWQCQKCSSKRGR